MHRRALLALVTPLTLFAASAHASGKPAAKEGKAEVGQYVDLAPVALPIVVRGLVVNYIFVSVRIQLSAMANIGKLRTREPYFRDALVRAGHRAPFTRDDDYTKLDEAKLKTALLREAIAIGGARDVKGVTVLLQSPKKRTGLPSPASLSERAEIKA